QQENERDGERERRGGRVGERGPEEREQYTHRQERERVAEPPEGAQPQARPRVVLLGHQGGDRGEMVGLEGMSHAQEQPEEPGGDGGQARLSSLALPRCQRGGVSAGDGLSTPSG